MSVNMASNVGLSAGTNIDSETELFDKPGFAADTRFQKSSGALPAATRAFMRYLSAHRQLEVSCPVSRSVDVL